MGGVVGITCPLTAGEIRLLDCLNDSRDQLRKLIQRWDNRLTLENLSPLEDYVKGRLSMALNVHFGATRDCTEFSLPTNNHPSDLEGIPILVFSADVAKFRDRDHWNQHSVLIDDVQAVKGPQGVIRSVVRLYRLDDQIHDIGADIGPRSLFFTLQGAYHFLLVNPNGKRGVRVGSATAPSHNIKGQMIEGASQIVGTVANYQSDIIGERLRDLKLQDIESRLSIFLDTKAVEVCLKKSAQDCHQLADVMLGPFDL